MARNFVAASSQKLSVGSTPVTAAAITLACWYRPVSIAVGYRFFGVDAGGSVGESFALGQDSTGHVSATTTHSSSPVSATSTTAATANVWAHACAVFTSASSRAALLNGAGKGTNSSSSTPTGLNTIEIGTVGGAFMNGDLAECAIWNVALSDAQVADLANGISPLFIAPANLVFYAPLSQGYSPEIDLIGARSLTLTNSPVAAVHPRIFNPSTFDLGIKSLPKQISASLAMQMSLTGNITNTHQISAALAMQMSLSPNLSVFHPISAALAMQFDMSANIVRRMLLGTTALSMSMSLSADTYTLMTLDAQQLSFTMSGSADIAILKLSVSDAMREALYAQETCAAFIVLLTIDHPSLAAIGGPLRVCSDAVDVVSRGQTFFAYPFKLSLPDSNPDSPPRASITIDSIDREIINALRGLTSAPTITFEVIQASDPNTIEVSMPDFNLTQAQYDSMTIQGDLGVEQFLQEPYPYITFSPNYFPGLF